MLQFLDPSVREGAALRHALLTSSGTSAAAAKRALDAAMARGVPEVQRFALQLLIKDAVVTRFWVDTAAENTRLVLLREHLQGCLQSPGRVGLFTDAFDTVEVSESLVGDFLGSDKLHLSTNDQLAVILGLTYAANEGTRMTGKKLLAKRLAEVNSEEACEKFVNSVGDDQTVRAIVAAVATDVQFQGFFKLMAAHTNAHGPTLEVPKNIHERTDCHVTLAAFVEELGPVAVATAEDAKETLAMYPWPVDATEVAGCLALFMRGAPSRHDTGSWSSVRTALVADGTAAKRAAAPAGAPAWQHANFVDAVIAATENLDWNGVLAALDSAATEAAAAGTEPIAINVAIAAYRKATGSLPPVLPFLKPWLQAPRAQLQVLRFYAANPDVFERSGLLTLSAALVPPQSTSGDYSAAWHSPAFTAALLDCAAVGGYAVERDALAMVVAAAKLAPAAVTTTLLLANTQRSLRVHHFLSEALMACGVPVCLTPDAVDFVFKQNRGPMMLRTLTLYISADHGRAASVLPVLQQGRLFPRILAVATDPVVHVILAISGQECGHVPTHYLSDALSSTSTPKDMPVSRVPLAMATVDVCDDLLSKGGTVSVALRTALTAVANSGLAPIIPSVLAHARSLLSASHFGSDPSADDTEHVQEQFPAEIETTAAGLVEAACKTTDPTSSADVKQCLELKESSNDKKRMLLRCVGKTVLEEAACVNQYPPSALVNFSRFFGLLVKHDMLEAGDLKLALRIVLQSVVAPSDPRMRDFGVAALSQFKTRLPEWPAFRRSLRRAPDLDMYLPGIIAYLNASDKSDQAREANSATPGAASEGGADGKAGAPADATAHLHQHDIKTLLSDSTAPQPSSVARDRINFILGNTDTNVEKMEAHARELKSLVTSEFFQYFAEYLVVKRVALEPNNHKTYLQLVEMLESPDLEAKLRRATISACRRLIDSEKVRTNSSERSLLKSLGSWLGQLTLARNVPVLARDLDMRDLVPNALRDGKLIAIVPFIAKLIEHSANSRAFRIPNPLIMSLLGQLAEMYHLDDLKITLRFEVEVLCRNLHVSITELVEFAQKERPHREPLHELKRRAVDVNNSYDFRPSTDDSEPMRTKLTADAAPYEPKVGGNGNGGSGSGPGPSGAPAVHTDITNQVLSHHMMRQATNMPIAHFLQISDLNPGRELQNIPQQHHGQYRAMLKHAFDSGLLEAHGALDRSAAVACNTAREIAAKDFSRERNDTTLSISAHAMARGLATTLVSVSARDTAFNLIRKHLSSQLPRVFTPETVGDVIENLLNENVTGISNALEEATIELTAIKMDQELSRLFDDRHQAWRTSERCYPREHVSAATASALAALPDALRPSGSLAPFHINVYASFLPPRVDNTVEQVVQLLQVIEEAALRHYTECPPTDSAHVLSLTNVSFTETSQSEHHDVIKKKLVEVNQWITEGNAVPLLVNLFPRIMLLAEKVQAESRNPAAHNTVMHHGNLLLNEVCLFVLQAIREKGQGKAVSELMRLYSLHEKRWVNKELAANLIRLRLMDIAEFDRVLTKALQEPNRQVAVEFAGYIVQKCLIEGKLANVRDLKHTLEILEQIADQSKKQRAPTRVRVPTMHKAPYRQEIEKYFDEWLLICDKKTTASASNSLQQQQQQQQKQQQQQQQSAPAANNGAAAAPAAGSPASAAPAAGGQAAPGPDGQPPSKQVVALSFVKKLQDSGMLKADTMLDHFFGVLTELAVEDYATTVMLAERALTPEQRQAKERARPDIGRVQVHPPAARLAGDSRAFVAVDAFSDLIVVLIKCCAWSSRRDDAKQQQGHAETALIQRVLTVVGRALTFNHDWCVDRNSVDAQYHEQPPLPEGCAFEETHMQQPFMRLFSNLMIALSPSADERGEFFVVVANTLHALNPQRLPGFAFGWIELVGHRLFISKLLRSQEHWPLYYKLVNDALRFVEPFARPQGMHDALVLYFKCVLKLMLLLLHDFSEFLLAHHQLLCDAIPPCCIQLRNIVLSAFPRHTKLPDPFSRSGKYNQLPELRQAPTISPVAKDPYTRPQLQMPVTQAEFDSYLVMKQPADLPKRLIEALTPAEGKGFNVPLISAVVLYTGVRTVERQAPLIKEAFDRAEAAKSTVDPDPLTFNGEMGAAEILRQLIAGFSSEGRYHVINACVNQLRFPNSHTHFFSLALQHLFAVASPHQEHTQEHITRVLVERLIISRPHPWGLLITFFDIVKDAKNDFWEKPFIRCTPEIERMFESVAQSVHPQQQQQQQQAAAAQQQAATTQPQQQAAAGQGAPVAPSGVVRPQ